MDKQQAIIFKLDNHNHRNDDDELSSPPGASSSLTISQVFKLSLLNEEEEKNTLRINQYLANDILR